MLCLLTAEKASDQKKDPKPLKEKTTKAERRALQEAQRAAKAAAKGPFFVLYQCVASLLFTKNGFVSLN